MNYEQLQKKNDENVIKEQRERREGGRIKVDQIGNQVKQEINIGLTADKVEKKMKVITDSQARKEEGQKQIKLRIG